MEKFTNPLAPLSSALDGMSIEMIERALNLNFDV